MIRYSLKCANDHMSESWFQSASAFDTLVASRHIACPECGSTDVTKALMAPSVGAKLTDDRIAELRRKVESNSEYVGKNFATEARRIHDGDAPERAIYGEAKPDEARKLIEDGVPVAPLPFMPSRRTN